MRNREHGRGLVLADLVGRGLVPRRGGARVPRVTFLPDGRAVEVPRGSSILEAAEAAGVELPHNCGGVCACTTCHVLVEQGFTSLSEIEDHEDDKLNEAEGLTARSRL